MTPPILLTRAQMAEALQVGLHTLDKWTREGRIPALRDGRTVRYSPEAVRNHLAAMEPERSEVQRRLRAASGVRVVAGGRR